MPWKYSQSTGRLTHNCGGVIATGYSGNGECKNCPDKQDVAQHGPIPRGLYTIGHDYYDPRKGQVVMHLDPDPANEMFGRTGFLIHGDSIGHPGCASEGCIILAKPVRTQIAASLDKKLEVVE